jgi:4-carboxymuconolactone decarboxylase
MTRLPHLNRDQLDHSGRSVWDLLVSTRGEHAVDHDGDLIGPYNAWVHAPEIGLILAELGNVLRFGTSLDRRLLELAIIVTGAHWKSEFEWWAHARIAKSQGISPDAIDAIGRGESFDFENHDERVVYAIAKQTVVTGQIDPSTYAEAQLLLGHKGMVELVSLCGYYTLVSFTLNAFAIPLPPGVSPQWA